MAYGKIIPGLMIHGIPAPYGVVNEREVRAAAGIMFAIGLVALLAVYFDQNIKLAFGVVLAYWIDFILKVAFGPEWSYIGRIGGWIVRKQRPEYVGAIQKRFAWSIGLVLSSIVLFLIGRNLLSESCANPILSGVSPCFVPMLICGVCLIFMWLETSAGICVGCHIYAWLAKRECINRGEYAPVCPGGVCDVKEP
jgi:hypothetical protein